MAKNSLTGKSNIDGFIPRQPNRRRIQQPQPRSRSINRSVNKTAVAPKPASMGWQATDRPLINFNLPNEGIDSDLKHKKTRNKNKIKKKWSRKRKVLTSIAVFLLIIIGIGGWYGIRIVGSLDKVFHGNIFSDAKAIFSTTTLNGESSGRVNILVAGNSADDPDHQGANLTDSIMLVSIDTKNHTGFLFSIPRDLWINIPGIGNEKINSAITNTSFHQSGYPSGGMGQLQEVVTKDLGIPVDYYALVDYGAFKDAVDAVGGITIDIQSTDPRGLYDAYTHLKLPNGEDTLNGQEALNLARARGDDSAGDISYGFPATDFDRTQHQRQMVVAIVKKASSLGVLGNPNKVTDLFSALGNNVQTNLSLADAKRLAQILKIVNLNNLGSYTYPSTLTSSTNPIIESYIDPVSRQDALAPTAGLFDFTQLQEYYEKLVTNNPVLKEGATVTVLNASGVNGLASQQQTLLQKQGLGTVAIGDASKEYPGTMVVDNSDGKDPNTKALLEKMYPGQVVTSSTGNGDEAGEAYGYSTNFVVILGENWSQQTTTAATN